MERVRFVEHRGARVLCLDLSGLSEMPEMEVVAEEAGARMRAEAPGSVLVLVDVSGVPFSLRTVRRLAEIAAGNAAYVRGRAVVGAEEAHAPLAAEIAAYTRKPVRVFPEPGEALDWLVSLGAG